MARVPSCNTVWLAILLSISVTSGVATDLDIPEELMMDNLVSPRAHDR